MPLDTQTQTLLKRLEAINFALTDDMTPTRARARSRALAQWTASRDPEPVAHIEDRHIPGPAGEIPLRFYTPQGSGPFPILIYFHSGGGVIGDLDSEDGHCRRLTNLAECLVISVDYHLAPEHKFPSAPEECYAATEWIAAHAPDFNGDPTRIAVGGMSSGANLATVVTLMVRDRGTPSLIFQLLLVPITDYRSPDTSSLEDCGEGYLLTKRDMTWFAQHYFGNKEDRLQPLASPYLAPTLAGLPPALVMTAEYDPLRDDGERYGNRLKEAGVPVTISCRPGAIHGFLVSGQLNQALAEAAVALRTAFAV